MDDWGCVSEEDLFFSAGSTKSLDELVESLSSSDVAEDLTLSRSFPLSTGISQNIQVVPCVMSSSPPTGFAPKILKKKSVIRGHEAADRRATLKKVTFDVEKFAADECEDSAERENARARLAIRLGAKPAKKPFVNYKSLKAELGAKKLAPAVDEKHSALLALKSPLFKKKAKGKKSRK